MIAIDTEEKPNYSNDRAKWTHWKLFRLDKKTNIVQYVLCS